MSKAIPVTLGAVMGSVLCLSAAATPADVRTQFKALLEIRESLRAELQKRWDTTRPQVLELRAVDGADTYDLELAVKQSDGKWVGSLGWVPAWDQLTMGDYRAYFYSSHGTGFLLPRHAFPGDPASLSLKDGRLGGSMPIAFKLDQTLIEKMPPGRRHNWWDRFEPRGFTKDRPQTYSFDAKTDPASIGVEMFLQGAVEYPPAKDGKHNPYAQSILVRMQAPGTRFTPTDVTIMSFNMGKHEGNAEGVKFANGHLTGELVVTINSDSWYPNTTKIRPASSLGGFTNTLAQTGKLLGRLPPIIATFALDAKLENNRLRGSYTARGDMGEFTGKIVGHGGTAVLGRYTSTGAMPNQSGMVRGMLLNDFGKVDAMLTPAPELPAEDPAALAAVAAAVGDVVVEARALHLALQAHPLPLFHALDQVDTTRPQWPAEGPSPEALAAYVTAAVSALKSALPPDAKPPEAAAEAGGASPSSGSAAMAVADGANVLPPTFGGWLHPVAWSVIGGFDERPGFEHRTAFVPDIVVAPGTPVRQMIGSGGAFANPSGSVRSWTNIVADTRTMMPPFFRSWDQALGKGQFSQVYYGAAKIRSDSARKVWINMETHDYAGVWMNGRLLWSETRLKSVRQRPLGRFVAQAEVEKGDNVLLARMVQDRRTPYVAISFSADDPKAGTPVPAPAKDPLDAKAEPANPPTACDVEKGVNVLWRSADMAGDTPPAVVGDRVWVTRHHDELVCLDAETGKPKWAQRLNAYEALGLDAEYQKALGETDARSREDMLRKLAAKLGTPNVALSASAPVTDGRTTFLANAIGEVAAFDAAGKKVWSKPTDVFNPQVHRYGDTLVVQGYAGKSWPKTDYVSPFATDAKRQPVGVVLFRAADGVEIGRSSNNRKPEIGMFLQPRGSDKVYYVSNGYILLDLATGKAAAIVDIHAPYDQAMCASQGVLYMTGMGWANAVLVYQQPDGKLAWREIWNSMTDRKGWQDAPCTVHDGKLWYWNHAVDHGPHCADRRSMLFVADAWTGAPLMRVKPILRETVGSYARPVVAGDYLCMLAGGGHPFGNGDASRMSMITTDGNYILAQPEMKLEYMATQPVFAGDRLFVRSRSSLMCIAAKDKAFEAREMAANLFKWIGPEPLQSKTVEVAPAADLVVGNDVPVDTIRPYPPDFWLGAGPFPGNSAPDEKLAALRPRIGTEATLNGKTLQFQPLPRREAGNVTPSFSRQGELQGTGDSMPAFDALLDPTFRSGKDASGLFYTVVDNPTARVVKPAYFEDRMRGITVWVNGYQVGKDEPMRLAPGLYPVMIRIDPAFYDRSVRLDEMPIDVGAALAAKAAEEVNWPRTWRVLGPLPVDLKSLPGESLTHAPADGVRIEGEEFGVYDVPVRDGGLLPLAGLMFATRGVAYDWAKSPLEVEVMTPFTAYAFAEIEAPRDGSLYVNAGADWFMRWYVDGEAVLDTMQSGNPSGPRDVKSCAFEVPLKKGKHTVCVMTKPGSKGWSVSSIGAFSAKPKAELKPYELVRGRKEDFDFRFRPYFAEMPNPEVIADLYRQRLKAAESRLRSIEKSLPGSPEAKTAQLLLTKLGR